MNGKERESKLLDAIIEGKKDVALKLIQKGADLTAVRKGDNAIHLAARKGWLDLIKALHAKGTDLSQKNVNGNTAAHYAGKGGFLNIIIYLMDNGIDLNVCNTEGQTPLHEAVIQQPMDVIESLVDLGMDVNKQNKETGETPVHTAVIYARHPALEGLLLKGASLQIRDHNQKKPEDVAKSSGLRETIRMYDALKTAMKKGFILAKGMQITPEQTVDPLTVDRVGIIIERIDIPKEFPATFYCRREKSENASVTIPTHEEENIFSDVFHIQLTNVNRNCPVKFLLPLYLKPTIKEQMVLRFINHEDTDRHVDEYRTIRKKNYCVIETTLVPETTCICIVYIKPKREETVVTKEKMLVTSAIDKDFSLTIPEKAFTGNTVLSLKVYETNDDILEDQESEEESEINDSKPDTSEDNTDTKYHNTHVEQESAVAKAKHKEAESMAVGLVTDVFQINVTGDQPKKSITMQMPMFKGCSGLTDLNIIRAEENTLHDETPPEVLPIKPEIVGCNLVFEVSHFSIYVAAPKEKTATLDDLMAIKARISSAKDKRKAATFFAVIKQVEGYKHTLLVDCGLASQKQKRFDKWTKDEYEIQDPDESETILLTPGDTFCIGIKGNASFEDKVDSERKLSFSKCRSSFQAYNISLNKRVRNASDGLARVCILKKTDNALKEVARLPIKLHVPPPPPKWATVDQDAYKPPKADNSPYQSLKSMFGQKDKSKKK